MLRRVVFPKKQKVFGWLQTHRLHFVQMIQVLLSGTFELTL